MTSLHSLLAMVGGLDLKSVRYRRDTLTVVFFIWAVMREVPQIIGALMQAGVEPYLEDKTAWNKLLGIRERWKGSGLQSDIRSRVAFTFHGTADQGWRQEVVPRLQGPYYTCLGRWDARTEHELPHRY